MRKNTKGNSKILVFLIFLKKKFVIVKMPFYGILDAINMIFVFLIFPKKIVIIKMPFYGIL